MSFLTESDIEQATLEWLSGLGCGLAWLVKEKQEIRNMLQGVSNDL
ncbi:MAG: hypothetical protein PHW63_02360 [Alphaproteobacteria bacterium]|nr:hypothetical protein [Alphaproteobacteria bacterium]